MEKPDAKVDRDYAETLANLTAVQQRCTELLLENRILRSMLPYAVTGSLPSFLESQIEATHDRHGSRCAQ